MNQAPPPVTPANAGTTQTAQPAASVQPANKPKGGLFSWLGFGGSSSRRKQVKKNKNTKGKGKNKKNKKTRRQSRR